MNKREALLRDFLIEKEIVNLNVDSPERMNIHKKVLQRKMILKNVFQEFHHEIMELDRKYFASTEGIKLELGAGVCPIKQSYPDVLATDIVPSDDLDLVVDAQNMDFSEQSVRAIYGQNCFHHFPDPSLFFQELERVLVPGGGVVLIEPYYGAVASFLFKRLFSSEGFEKQADSWIADVDGPMNGANQALSYIVFKRDRKQFQKEFPLLEIVYEKPLTNYVRYFLSGGLNFKSLIPSFLDKPFKVFEFLLKPLSRFLALHHVIVIRRKKSVCKVS